MKVLLADRASNNNIQYSHSSLVLKDLLSVLQFVVEPQEFVITIWSHLNTLIEKEVQRQVIWREFISMIAAAKLLSVSAEAFHASKDNFIDREDPWIVNGSAYAAWLGLNVYNMALKLEETDLRGWKALSQFFRRSLTLGYNGIFFYLPEIRTYPTNSRNQLR